MFGEAAPIIELRDVFKSYGRGPNRTPVLTGVNLAIRQGGSVAIRGGQGSGGVSLHHMLALLDTPDRGVVRIGGIDIATLNQTQLDALRNKTFGFAQQQYIPAPDDTVLSSVTRPLKIAGMGRAERNRRGLAALTRLDLLDMAKRRTTTLSWAQRQDVVIARALVNKPRVIFADIPTSEDAPPGGLIEDILFTVSREHGVTLVITTPDQRLADRCDRRIRLRRGVIVESSDSTAISAAEELTA